jgi:ABC-2 type transport system permease protein
MNALPILIRREFWEHRALWMAPLAVAALILGAAAFGRVRVNLPDSGVPVFTPEQRINLLGWTQFGITTALLIVASLVVVFYLLDCLYAERRDRSILFWKSLPVSDATTVLSKALVALVVVPVGVLLLAALTNLLVVLAVTLVPGEVGRFLEWDAATWLRVHGFVLLALPAAMLWCAPVAGYLMLVSAWARRNVFLWAVLPPAIVFLLEERLFDTNYAFHFVAWRLTGLWSGLALRGGARATGDGEDGNRVDSVAQVLGGVDLTGVFTRMDLWLGVLAAALLVFAAIRIRRFRDDT